MCTRESPSIHDAHLTVYTYESTQVHDAHLTAHTHESHESHLTEQTQHSDEHDETIMANLFFVVNMLTDLFSSYSVP